MTMNSPLLQIKNLKRAFVAPDGSRHLIVDVPEFSVDEHKQVALAGDPVLLRAAPEGPVSPRGGAVRAGGPAHQDERKQESV